MHYDVFLWTEGKRVLGEFPDCPGCQTFAEAKPDAVAGAMHEALNGWLEAHLIAGQVPPRPVPRTNAPDGKSLSRVPVRPTLAAALAIRWARQDKGLSQKELGRRLGISQQQVAKLENPDENPTLETLAKLASALGLTVSVAFETEAPPTLATLHTIGHAHGTRESRTRAKVAS
jgi:DNA-binding XRE family transcriptional regulator